MNRKVVIVLAAMIFVAAGVYLSGMLSSEYDNIISVNYSTLKTTGSISEDSYSLISKFLNRENNREWKESHVAISQNIDFDVLLDISLENGDQLKRYFIDDKDNQQISVMREDKSTYTLDYDDVVFNNIVNSTEFATTIKAIPQTVKLSFKDSDVVLNPSQVDLTKSRIGNTETYSYSDKNAIAFLTLTEANKVVDIDLEEGVDVLSYSLNAITDKGTQSVSIDNNSFKPISVTGKTLYKLNIELQQSDRITTTTRLSEFLFEIDLNVPPIAAINKKSQPSGGFFMIHCDFIKPLDTLILEQNILEETPEFKRIGKEAYVVIPLNYWSVPNRYNIKVKVDGIDGISTILDQDVYVTERAYSMQNLTVDNDVEAETRTNDAYAEYHEKFIPVRLTSADEQYWEGPFIVPTIGEITTDYGTRRTVNDELTSYRHNGIDYGAPEGSDILASNTGKVVFAEFLTLTGNTVVIDHGLGLFSYYLHCSKINVSVDDMVTKGDVIAEVGSTGFSTGPHLHFTTSYHLSNIDPLHLLEWNGEWPE